MLGQRPRPGRRLRPGARVNLVVGKRQAFRPPPTDTVAPSTPSGLHASASTTTGVTVAWTASTDNVGVAGYVVYLNGSRVASVSGTSATLSGLACGHSYKVGVNAYDAAGNHSGTSSVNAATSGCPDTTPPSAPSGLHATAETTTSVTVAWTASTDNVGVAGYVVYLNGNQVSNATGTSATLSSLSCGHGYTIGVNAYDGAGNHSVTTGISASTNGCPDTAPPSAPSGVHVTAHTTNSLTVAWTASTDNVGVAGYFVYLNSSHVASATGTSTTVKSLVCGHSYGIGVNAYDAAGNHSTTTSISASTSACPPPPLPTGKILASPCLNFHNAPHISATLIGCVPLNTIITIKCTASGDAVTGPYGTESTWDYTTYGGKNGYVADAWVYTGSNYPVAGACSNPSPVKTEVDYWLAHITQYWQGYPGEEGTDFSMPEDTPIYAVQGGTVLGVGYYGGGGVVSIKAGNQLAEYYQHLDCINVSVGQAVSAGQKIGTSGGSLTSQPYHPACGHYSTSTYSTGPHLEFGINATYGGMWNPGHYTPNTSPLPLLDTLG